jgi:hypothetical protein
MCGRKTPKQLQTATAGPYEGKTKRLDPGSVSQLEHYGGRPTWKHVPCWAWWLIWPLIELGKLMFRVVTTTGAVVVDWLASVSLLQLWPIALIVIGLVLLRQSRR